MSVSVGSVDFREACRERIGISSYRIITKNEIFQRGQLCALFNPFNLAVVYFHSSLRGLLDSLEEPSDFRSFEALCINHADDAQEECEYWRVILDMLNNDMIVGVDLDEDSLVEAMRESERRRIAGQLLIMPSLECNFRCRDCYFPSNCNQILSVDDAKRCIDLFVDAHSEGDSLEKNVHFLGGEPLLHYDLISKIMAYLDEKRGDNKDRGLQFHYSLITNGSLVEDKWIDLFKRYRMDISVSLDGRQESNDRMRITDKGEGAYEATARGIELLNGAGIVPSVALVVGPHNIDTLAEEIRWIYENMNISTVSFSIVSPQSGCDGNSMAVEKLVGGLSAAYDKILKWGLVEGCIQKHLDSFRKGEYSTSRCPAIEAQSALFPDGHIGPCPRYALDDGQKEGVAEADIIGGTLWRRWLSYDRLSSPHCMKNCNLFGFCEGWCPYLSELCTGSLSQPNAYSCALARMYLEKIIWYRYEKS